MKLTEQEEEQRTYLNELCASKTVPMMPELQKRLKYLNAKAFHNCCSNPHCTGYEGTDKEIICPKCQSKLIKSI
jgi:uncharacterized paraquat-inducible protein A